MKDLIENQEILSNSSYSVLIAALALSILLSKILFHLTKKLSKELEITPGIEKTLFFLPPIVMSIIFFVGSSLSLSIGLLGSLSIIRFRTAIKSSMELVLILTAIMIGIGLGSQNFILTTISSLFIFSMLLTFTKFFYKKTQESEKFYLSCQQEQDSKIKVDEYLNKLQVEFKLNSVQNDTDKNLKSLYELVDLDKEKTELLIGELRERNIIFSLNKS